MPDPVAGIGVSPGEAAGPLLKLAPSPGLPPASTVDDAAAEAARAEAAVTEVSDDLARRAESLGGHAGDIVEAQALMARDPLLLEGIAANVHKGLDAPHAIHEAFAAHRQAFAAAGGMLADRVADLDYLRDRAVAVCLGAPLPGVPDPGHPFVLAAADLAPADTAALNLDLVQALVTRDGGPTSHTAILARSAGLPAVVGCRDVLDIPDGAVVSVDGSSGAVTVGVTDDEVTAIRDRERDRRRELAGGSGPGRTADGHPVPLLVNAGAVRDIPAEAEGVGLLRTELLYLDRETPPTMDEQVAAYREIFDALGERPVVVRTLDAGADKPLPFLHSPDEPNPALGVRGLRLARRDPSVLDTQLTAIAHAASRTRADVKVMAPMVATAAEARDFADRAHDAGLRQVGVMVEIPSAALCAAELLEHVDFLSIGTNDLSQYTFAADRQSSELADLLDPRQPALLWLIGMCAEAAVATDKSVGVCGEAAAVPELAPILVGLGVTSLSMSAGAVAGVRRELSRHTAAQCRRLAREALPFR